MAKATETLPKLPYGQGSYSWRDKDHTEIMYRKPISENGIKKTIYVYGQTIAECNKKMRIKEKEFVEKYEYRIEMKSPKITLSIGMYNWLFTYKFKKKKDRTFDTLESTYNNQILTSEIANMQIEEITDDDLQKTINRIADDKSLSTTKKTYSILKQYFKYHYAAKPFLNPMNQVQIPTEKFELNVNENNNEINFYKDYEVLNDNEIVEFSKEASIIRQEGILGYKYGYGIIFIFWCYVRFGEAIALQWKDIDFNNKIMYVYKSYSLVKERDQNGVPTGESKWQLTTTKSKSGRRKIPLIDEAINALLEFKNIQNPKNDNDFILSTSNGNPVSDTQLNRNLKTILSRAGIVKHITIHGLRHSGISYCLRHGVNVEVVSKLAGHNNIQVTQDIYYSVIEDQKIKSVNQLNIINKEI